MDTLKGYITLPDTPMAHSASETLQFSVDINEKLLRSALY